MITELVIQKVFQVLTSFLKEKYNDSDGVNSHCIRSFSVKSGCGTAENYLSKIYAINCDVGINSTGVIEKYDLIFKSQIISADTGIGADAQKYFWNAIFHKESAVYQEVVQDLEKLGNISLSPKIHQFFTEGEDYCCLIFDNLVSLGYYTPSPTKDLSFDECSALMKNIARFHALSLVLEAEAGGHPLPEKYEVCQAEMMFSRELESVLGAFYKKQYLGIMNAAKTCKPDLAVRMGKLHSEVNIWNRLCKLIKPKLTSFACLCHGDPRPANLFFRKAGEDGILEMKFIDFQLTRYASPITDLQYAFALGTRRAFRDEHLDKLLGIYFNTFISVLTAYPDLSDKINPKATSWTFEMVKKEFKESSLYGFLIGVTLRALLLTGELKNNGRGRSKQTPDEMVQSLNNYDQFITNCMIEGSNMRDIIYEVCDEAVENNVI